MFGGTATADKPGNARAAGPGRLVWKREHWNALGASALDGGLIGFAVGFAANMSRVEFVTTYLSSYPARALAFTLIGAAIAVAINAIYLLFTSRSAVEGQAT